MRGLIPRLIPLIFRTLTGNLGSQILEVKSVLQVSQAGMGHGWDDDKDEAGQMSFREERKVL